jgi:protein phosphatase
MKNYEARSDVGLVRSNNEDSYLIVEKEDEEIFIVADGMGGHKAGEVASLEACRKIEGYLKNNEGKPEVLLKDAVKSANRDIFNHASSNEAMRGMGTTVDALLLKKDDMTLAHVGDSRVYIISKDSIRQITKDHSIVEMMLESGSITEEEAKNHPQRHYITRAVGSAYRVDVDIIKEKLNEDECVLMCTDGLTNMLGEEEILKIVSENESLSEAADILLARAKDNGGVDNITFILFKR